MFGSSSDNFMVIFPYPSATEAGYTSILIFPISAMLDSDGIFFKRLTGSLSSMPSPGVSI